MIHLVAVGGCRVDVERTNLNQTEPGRRAARFIRFHYMSCSGTS